MTRSPLIVRATTAFQSTHYYLHWQYDNEHEDYENDYVNPPESSTVSLGLGLLGRLRGPILCRRVGVSTDQSFVRHG